MHNSRTLDFEIVLEDQIECSNAELTQLHLNAQTIAAELPVCLSKAIGGISLADISVIAEVSTSYCHCSTQYSMILYINVTVPAGDRLAKIVGNNVTKATRQFLNSYGISFEA